MKIGEKKAIKLFKMRFYLNFLCFFCYMDAARRKKRTGCQALVILSENRRKKGSDFLAGVNEITLTYAREAPLWY
jgi:hypothetical protein